MKKLNKENISKIKNVSGYYKIFNKNRKLEYVGVSKVLRHRLQSYYQKDDFTVNKTKRSLRPHAKNFTVAYMGINQARRLEKEMKKNTPHNKL